MTKRAFAEVTGHHDEQRSLKRKEDGHAIYVPNGMEHDRANVEKDGCMPFQNEGDTETRAELDSAGKIAEASALESFSSQKEYSNSDALLNNEDDISADSSSSYSELSIVFSASRPNFVNKDCQRSNPSQYDQAPISQVDQAFTSFTSSSEAIDATIVNNHLSSYILLSEKDRLPEILDIAVEESNIHEEFENHNDLKNSSLKLHNTSRKRKKGDMPNFTEYGSCKKACRDASLGDNSVGALGICGTPMFDANGGHESNIHEEFENHNDLKNTSLKLHNTSRKRKKDDMPDFTEYGSCKKACREASLGDNSVGALGICGTPMFDANGGHPDTNFSYNNFNSGMPELAGGILEMQNNINGETALQSYLKEGPLIKADAAEKDIVVRTSNCLTCSVEAVGQHKSDSMPFLTECGSDENPEKASQKTIQATVPEKVNCAIHEENLSERSFSSAISIEINQKVLYANFKGELSLPPSPITGVIDCFVGKPNGGSNHLDSLIEEETTFSFQIPNKSFSKEIPRNKFGFVMQGALKRVDKSSDCSQNLIEHPLKVMSVGINEGRVTQQEIIASSFSSALEDDPLPKEKKKEVQDIGSIPPEISFSCHTGKKLLVLDLNGLLCDIVNDYYSYYPVEKKIGGKPFFKRPFCDDFLKFCFDHFHIGIWSSRRKYNVDSALDYLMGEFKHKLLFCWDQSKCTYTGARTIENHHKPLVLKELKKLWDKEESDLPWEKGDFSASNTLLIDDSPYKALCNPLHTAIFPHPYQYTDERDNSLGPGGDIRVYLEQLLVSDDVQRFVEEHPFGQPAITASDQNWYFYCQIIKSNSTQLSSERYC